jgi:hypothetical protein
MDTGIIMDEFCYNGSIEDAQQDPNIKVEDFLRLIKSRSYLFDDGDGDEEYELDDN